jgi:hypothetical protein
MRFATTDAVTAERVSAILSMWDIATSELSGTLLAFVIQMRDDAQLTPTTGMLRS